MFLRATTAVLLASAALGSAPVAAQDIASESFDCLVQAKSVVEVGAPVSGVVQSILPDRGDRVKMGDPLFVLQSDVERADFEVAQAKAANDKLIAVAQAQFDLAKANAERMSNLRDLNANALNDAQIAQALADEQVAENNLLNAQLNQQVAILDAARAKAALDERTVLSPIDGVVLERTLSAGEYRHDRASVLTLVELDPLYVEAYLPKVYFGQVSAGETGKVTLEAPLGTTHDATVRVVDPLIDAASGTFGVRLILPNNDFAIPAGLRCTLHFD